MKSRMSVSVIVVIVLAALLPFAGVSAQNAPVLADSEWQLVSLGGVPVLEGTSVTLSFVEEGQVSGSAGCNRYGAEVTLDGSSITIGTPFTTRMMCAQEGVMEQEQSYLTALQAATSISVSGGSLTLTGADGTALVFSAISPLAGTNWAFVSLEEGGVFRTERLADTVVTLAFSAEGAVSGSAGCNRYTTRYTVDGSSITFGPIMSTMMACAPEVMDQEAAFTRALEGASSFTLLDGQLILTTAEGAGSIVLRPLSVLAGTEWTLSTWNTGSAEVSLVEGSAITLGFGYDDDAFGSTGCNRFRGGVLVEDDAITFGPAATTRMMCEPALAEQETAWLSALAQVAHFRLGENQLTLITNDGSALSFVPGSAR